MYDFLKNNLVNFAVIMLFVAHVYV